MKRWAVISNDGSYRYELGREWDPALPRLVWLMLNPSTADAEQDDATVRRCIRYSDDWGYGSMVVVNLMAWRSTDPRGLWSNPAAVGPVNRSVLQRVCRDQDVVCAWGAAAGDRYYVKSVASEIQQIARRMFCLGTTADGNPLHPVRQRADLKPVRYVWTKAEGGAV